MPDRASRFRKPPVSSRTVGFPESGWRLWLSPRGLPNIAETKVPTHIRPLHYWFAFRLDASRLVSAFRVLCPALCRLSARHMPRAPLPASGCYPLRRGVSHHVRRHYPSFVAHIGSWARPKPSFRLRPWPRSEGLCRLLSVPAGRWPFPALSPQSLYRCLDPYHAMPLRCIYPFLPEELRPHFRIDKFGASNTRRYATSTTRSFSRLQSFLYVQAPTLARPPGCTHRLESPKGGRAVYTTQWT